MATLNPCWLFMHGIRATLDFLAQHWESLATLLFSGLLTFFTSMLWRSTSLLWEETKRAGDTAAKAADAATKAANASVSSMRPWLSCKVGVCGGWEYLPNGDARVSIKVVIQNVGHSPAMTIKFSPWVTFFSTQHEHSILGMQRRAELNRGLPVNAAVSLGPGGTALGSMYGLMLFPGEDHTENWLINVPRGDIVKAIDSPDSGRFRPEVCGLVTYIYPLASVRADTGFIRGLEVTGDGAGPLTLDAPVLKQHLRLVDSNLFADFAT
jgi:hypothetical protein